MTSDDSANHRPWSVSRHRPESIQGRGTQMSVTESAIAYVAKRYQDVTGKPPKRFMCPITLQDDPDAALCNGHILCQSIKTANRTTVVQRADVDNRFGTLVEGDFTKVANLGCTDPVELMK